MKKTNINESGKFAMRLISAKNGDLVLIAYQELILADKVLCIPGFSRVFKSADSLNEFYGEDTSHIELTKNDTGVLISSFGENFSKYKFEKVVGDDVKHLIQTGYRFENVNIIENKNLALVPAEKELSELSIDELYILIKNAVGVENYEYAREVKSEIDSRS